MTRSPSEIATERRKSDHIDMAFASSMRQIQSDSRFYFEPALSSHPSASEDLPLNALGRTMRFPIWVSSMTGGTEMARRINYNLARACNEFGLGLGLGSCRALLSSDHRLADFDVRSIIGDDLPLYANLGIAQIETSLQSGQVDEIHKMVHKLRADGLIIHVNPLQEWMQPEGDLITSAPLDTIADFIEHVNYPIIVKEVGQGFGPQSIRRLLMLPLQAIEFAAYGGTNFTRLELMRAGTSREQAMAEFAAVGHTAHEMVDMVNQACHELQGDVRCCEMIISGGVNGFLDGYYLMNKLNLKAVYGHASKFLQHAMGDYVVLQEFVQSQVEGLKLANAFLTVR